MKKVACMLIIIFSLFTLVGCSGKMDALQKELTELQQTVAAQAEKIAELEAAKAAQAENIKRLEEELQWEEDYILQQFDLTEVSDFNTLVFIEKSKELYTTSTYFRVVLKKTTSYPLLTAKDFKCNNIVGIKYVEGETVPDEDFLENEQYMEMFRQKAYVYFKKDCSDEEKIEIVKHLITLKFVYEVWPYPPGWEQPNFDV